MGCINATITIDREPLTANCALICDTPISYAYYNAPSTMYFLKEDDAYITKVEANTSWELITKENN